MLAGADNDVEISWWAAIGAGISFSRDAYALAVARARLYADLQRLRAFHHAPAVAGRTRVLRLACSTAARACHVELHAPAGLGHRAFAAAFRTRAWSSHHPSSAAVIAGVEARDVQAQHCATNGIPETDADLVLEVGA